MQNVAKILSHNQAKLAKLAKKYKIKLVYIYGSHARDQATPMSDIDLGIVFEEELSKKDFLTNQLKFGVEIEKKFDLEKVDVRNLNLYSPRFRFSVYSEGKLIYSKDENTRIDFQLKAIHEYNDHKYIYDLSNYYLLKRLKN